MRNYIPVDTTDLPDIFDITLVDKLYTFRIDYNKVTDYYTVTISNDAGAVLIQQEPLILNNIVGIDIPNTNLPTVDIKVMDESNTANDAGMGELGSNVQLYLDVIDPNGSETVDPTIKPLGYDPDEPEDQTNEEVSY